MVSLWTTRWVQIYMCLITVFDLFLQYRDFVFRKMFERPAVPTESRAEDVANNVRELCKLDPS